MVRVMVAVSATVMVRVRVRVTCGLKPDQASVRVVGLGVTVTI